MPRSKSAKKHLRQTKTRNENNRRQRSQLRTAVKAARTAGAETSPTAVKQAEQLLDRAGRKGLIHPNAAARLKSQLARKGTNPSA